MEKISVKDRLPNTDIDGKEYLCVVRTNNTSQEYKMIPWEIPTEYEDEVNDPFFAVVCHTPSGDYIKREVTHWFELPELPYRVNC